MPKSFAAALELPPRIRNVRVFRCRTCGFYYVRPMPILSEAELGRLYDQSYFPEYTAWWAKRRKRDAQRRLSALQRELKASGEILDIGCGTGIFLSVAATEGYNVRGLEVSRELAALAAEVSGRAVDIGRLEDLMYEDERFAAVYVDSVLEHVTDPKAFIQEVYRILKPGGVAYVVVPNEDSFAAKVLGIYRTLRGRNARLSPFTSPYHVIGFSKCSLARCFEDAGFHVAKISLTSGHEEIFKYADRIRQPKWWVLEIIFSVGEVIGMGCSIEGIFRKPMSRHGTGSH